MIHSLNALTRADYKCHTSHMESCNVINFNQLWCNLQKISVIPDSSPSICCSTSRKLAVVHHGSHSGATFCHNNYTLGYKSIVVGSKNWGDVWEPYLMSCMSQHLNNSLFSSYKAQQITWFQIARTLEIRTMLILASTAVKVGVKGNRLAAWVQSILILTNSNYC